MNAADSRQFVLDFFSELTGGDARCWDRVADDATWQLIARAKDFRHPSDHTKASYRKLVEDSVHDFPTGLRFTVLATTAEEDRVAVEGESFGLARTGKTYNNLYHLLVLLQDGRIRTVREYLDSGHVNETLGPKGT